MAMHLEIYFNTFLPTCEIMSKTTQETRETVKHTQETSTNPQPTYLQTATKFFDEIEKSVSQYRQCVEDYQQECVRSFRNNFESIISAQREFAEKSGTGFTFPEATEKIINNALESFNKVHSTQGQTFFAIISTATQSIKALNDNAKSFVDLNRSMTQLWIPDELPKRD